MVSDAIQHPPPPVIETPRLRLRGAELADFEAFAAMWADDRVTQFIGGSPRTLNESWLRFIGIVGMWSLIGYGYWMFTVRQTGALVGCGGLARFDRGIAELEDYPEAGWAIAPDAWGQGLVSEAMAAVMDWSDNVLRAPEARCIIDPGHAASERVAAKLGFEPMAEALLNSSPINVYTRR
ncbi:GNAT family N-acetyltransferase [Blastomonas sp.]|uniref:GNAT family N-acetyltransferase n=1 Tax=Blastomonas sp. TaxID=1909299 RepID=UPI003592EBC6